MTDLTKPSAGPQSPASAPATRVTQATRVPMSLPNTKLSVPDMPGFYLYWHLGKNVRAALKAGYTHVEGDELDVEQMGVANSAAESGSTDLGTRISIASGGTISEENLEPERLYLMKLPEEWHQDDVARHAKGSEQVAASLRAGLMGAEGDSDRNKRYMKTGQDLFYPKNRPA